MTKKQLMIVEKLNLKKTDKTFGASFVYGVRVFEYKSGLYVAFSDKEGKPKRDTCIFFNESHIATVSNLFLMEMDIADIDKALNELEIK